MELRVSRYPGESFPRVVCGHVQIIDMSMDDMFAAITEGNFEKMKELMDAKADIHAESTGDDEEEEEEVSGTVRDLYAAINEDNLDKVKKLIHAKADIHAEITGDDVEEVSGMFPDYDYEDGLTLFHVASQLGRTEIVKTLVNEGAKIKLEGRIGHGSGPRGRRRLQAIHLAAGNGKTETVEALIKLKADVNSTAEVTIDGYPGEDTEYPGYDSAIHFAADYGHADTVEVLVRLKADVSAKARYDIERQNSYDREWYVLQQMEPIHIAAWRGHVDVVKTLVRLGANIEAEGCMEQKGAERQVT